MVGAEIYIEGTETDPVVVARAALRAGHERLRSRLAELTSGEPSEGAAGAPVADLAGFCRLELREYLVAADRELETSASGRVEERVLVDALRVASAALDQQINDLAVASASDSIRIATMIAGALELYLRLEEFVRPTLTELSAVEGETGDAPAVIDVRQIARGGRHPRVFARYARLAPGETFVLVNSHDPKPLRREFEAMHPGAFSWDYLQTGPEEWRVRIGRTAGSLPGVG
jgi:uncharacterized protein (DUF2249 family)